MTAKKVIFIDRGGVIHADFAPKCTGKPSDLVMEKGAIPALRRIDRAQFRLVLFDNPDGLAFGQYSESAYEKLSQRFMNLLRRNRVSHDAHFACLIHPQGKGKYRRESVFRFPNVGIFKQAQQEYELDLSGCWVIGDRTREILAGQRAGCQTILVRTGAGGTDREYQVEPDAVADNLAQALAMIQEHELALTR